MKRFVSTLLALVVLLALMPAALADGPTEIVMWSLFSGEDGSTINKMVDDFNASQTDTHLTHIIIDYNNLMAKIALAAGDDSQCPNLIVTYATDLAFLADEDRIVPLEDTLAKYPEFDFSLSRYNPACEELNMYNGKRYAVTLDFPSEGMYANMELVNQYCPEVLEDNVLTWDEIKAVGAKLQEDGNTDIAVMTSEWSMNSIITAYLQFAKTWSSEDAQTLALDKEALIKGVNLWKECYDAGYLWLEGDDCTGRFAEGSAIFYCGGNWCMNAVNGFGFDFRFLASPQVDPNNVVLYGDAHSFMQPKRTNTEAQQRSMAQWMAYFYDHSIDWAQAGSLIAAVGPRETEEFAALPQAFVANNYEPYSPMYKYNSILTSTAINGFDWQPVYGHIAADAYADAVEKQTLDVIAVQ